MRKNPEGSSLPVGQRSREDVLDDFGIEHPTEREQMLADRIRELEAPRGEAVAWKVESCGDWTVVFDAEKAASYAADGDIVTPLSGSEMAKIYNDMARELMERHDAHPPAASGVVTEEHVSIAYTLPDTVQAIIDAAAAYEKKHGAWQDYRMSKRDDAFPVDKTERAIIVAYRQYTAALTASRSQEHTK